MGLPSARVAGLRQHVERQRTHARATRRCARDADAAPGHELIHGRAACCAGYARRGDPSRGDARCCRGTAEAAVDDHRRDGVACCGLEWKVRSFLCVHLAGEIAALADGCRVQECEPPVEPELRDHRDKRGGAGLRGVRPRHARFARFPRQGLAASAVCLGASAFGLHFGLVRRWSAWLGPWCEGELAAGLGRHRVIVRPCAMSSFAG
mmetsp:Transcript_123632/g.357623  ORF Transcript_123632/g.357623 Transcript_123632/m.357623 type:complete len:208 (-) Transcript_123632:226-849(-)